MKKGLEADEGLGGQDAIRKAATVNGKDSYFASNVFPRFHLLELNVLMGFWSIDVITEKKSVFKDGEDLVREGVHFVN